MKQRSTTSSIKQFASRSTLVAAAVLMVLGSAHIVSADSFDDKINRIQDQIDGYQSQSAQLGSKADTLQNKVNILNAQKRTIQAEVDLSQAKYNKLVAQIAANEKKLAQTQSVLSDTITNLIDESDTSPIELLASSISIGDFINQQETLSSVQDGVQTSINQIQTLKKQLADQKAEVEKVLADQKAQRDTLAAKEAEQAKLLADTRGEEAAYRRLISSKSSQIDSLRAQQRAANQAIGGQAVPGDPSRGGYPNNWYNAPQDSITDSWGMYNRECVSYTAWKVYQSGKHMPYWGGHGNANQWPSSADAAGIPTGSTPKVHSVAISMTGGYGHAMWVEAVYGDGSIYVSQMNYDLAGHYSEMRVSAGSASNFTYIYF